MTESATPVTKILLIRHGQSLANSGARTEDQNSNPLTECGRQQANDLVDRIGCKPALIVVSPFLRAQQTAEPLRKRFPDVRVEEWPVQEFTFLDPALYRNKTEADREPYTVSYWQQGEASYVAGPGAESFVSFLDRARETIRRLIERNPGGCVVIITHGFFMQAFRLLLLFPDATDNELMANFRHFHYVNFIHNVDALEFELCGGKIRLVGQSLPASFTLQGETSHA